MDTCDEVRKHLSAYLDGELPDMPAATVKAHLKECKSCATYRDELLSVGQLLDLVAPAPVADDFTTRVVAHVREKEPARVRLARLLGRPLPRLAVAAVLILAIGLGSGLALMGGAVPSPAPEDVLQTGVALEFGLEAFEPLPVDTVGGAYMELAWPGGGDGS